MTSTKFVGALLTAVLILGTQPTGAQVLRGLRNAVIFAVTEAAEQRNPTATVGAELSFMAERVQTALLANREFGLNARFTGGRVFAVAIWYSDPEDMLSYLANGACNTDPFPSDACANDANAIVQSDIEHNEDSFTAKIFWYPYWYYLTENRGRNNVTRMAERLIAVSRDCGVELLEDRAEDVSVFGDCVYRYFGVPMRAALVVPTATSKFSGPYGKMIKLRRG